MVVELVGAFNELAERMKTIALSTSSSHILFKSLKLSIPTLQTLPLAPDGRPLSRALSVAVILADLQYGCPQKCGNVIIPFPFWIGAGCYFNDTFSITFDNSSKPFFTSNNLEALDIFPNGTMTTLF